MSRRGGPTAERGAVSVYAIAVGGFLTLVALLLTQTAMLISLQHNVASAADLAALAASQAAASGQDGCATARVLARRNHAQLVACRLDYDVATVTARGESAAVWGKRFAFERKARAAPVDYLR